MTEYDAKLCLGYIQLDRLGDLETVDPDDFDSGSECVGCGQLFHKTSTVWVAVMGDGALFGPLCDLCASSE